MEENNALLETYSEDLEDIQESILQTIAVSDLNIIYFCDEILSKKQLELNSKNKYFVIDIMVYSVKDAIEILGDKYKNSK